jgi:hypothetical protein
MSGAIHSVRLDALVEARNKEKENPTPFILSGVFISMVF